MISDHKTSLSSTGHHFLYLILCPFSHNWLIEAYNEVIEEYKISAEEVAKVILNAAISANPVQRYLVGKYSETMMEAKRTMSDAQSHNMMDSQLLSSK